MLQRKVRIIDITAFVLEFKHEGRKTYFVSLGLTAFSSAVSVCEALIAQSSIVGFQCEEALKAPLRFVDSVQPLIS